MQQPPGEVLDFVKSLRKGEHVVLFEGDSEYARGIEFQFLQDGLMKGERCVYISIFDEPEEIERKMAAFGIEVKRYQGMNRLHVQKLHTSPASGDLRTLKEVEEFNSRVIATNESVPFRVVGRLYSPRVMSRREFEKNLKIEHSSQEESPRKNGITICSYPTNGMKPEINSDWFVSLLRSHDAAVFAPSPGNGVALYVK